jgi:exopolyphosphatase/guanosine-5'-triphosphate,3'-diphosphate pyrophosphatase
MLVAKPARTGFRVIDSFSQIVRLGEGLGSTGRLGDAAIARTIEALKTCTEKMQRRGVSRVRCVATEACRMAVNCGEFVEQVRAETGLDFDIITAEEESRLSVLGCESLFLKDFDKAIVFDIGGGSTEVSLLSIADQKVAGIDASISIPCGVVTLSEQFEKPVVNGGSSKSNGVISDFDYQAMVDVVRQRFEPFQAGNRLTDVIGSDKVQIIATSGTATTLAGLHLGLKRYDRKRVDGAWIDRASLFALVGRLRSMTLEQRASQPCIGWNRADLIVAGCAILEAVCGAWPFGRLQVADRGLREGVLLELMDREDSTAGE